MIRLAGILPVSCMKGTSFPDLPDGRFEPTETLFFCENLAKTAIVPIYILYARTRDGKGRKNRAKFFSLYHKNNDSAIAAAEKNKILIK